MPRLVVITFGRLSRHLSVAALAAQAEFTELNAERFNHRVRFALFVM
jgi:hypothetical protein